jgi:hypothetical protein
MPRQKTRVIKNDINGARISNRAFFCGNMARPEGFEPPALRFEA